MTRSLTCVHILTRQDIVFSKFESHQSLNTLLVISM